MAGKLGRLPRKEHPRTLKLSKYTASLPEPSKAYWEYMVANWPMLANDTVGDCTCACAGHMEQNWTAHTFGLQTPTDEQILAAYSAITGYIPGDPSTDNGAAITDVLDYWQDAGIAGRKILAWAEIDAADIDAIKQAVFIFGGLDIGFNVPQSAMDQFDAGQTWTVVPNSSIEGGHSVPILGYGSGGCTCVTWAKLQPMTWDFFKTYCDEAYAVITQDWLTAAQTTPIAGLDLAALQADLAALKQ